LVKEFGYTVHICARDEESQAIKQRAGFKARRWVMGRTHSRMNRFRRILTPWEKLIILIFPVVFLFVSSEAGFARTNVGQAKWNLAKNKVLYVVGYAHLDTQWRWDYQTTIDEYLKKTLDDNFYLFEKYPDYVFNFTGSNRYAMFKEYCPEKYKKLKEYIAKGHWFVSGSSVDEGDVLNVSPESVIRQVLYGNEYFRNEFGKESCDYMLPDCFGFPACMPSVWAHCGLTGFSTQKLTWNSANGIPFNIGLWEGPDGKSVIAAFNPGSYVGAIKGRVDVNEYWATRINENGKSYGIFADCHYYGVGDTGGAVREVDVNNYTTCLKNTNGDYKIYLTSSDQLYKDITDEQRQRLPRYKGDLLLIQHSAGSLTSQAYMKRWNRKNEQLADSAERAAVAAAWLGGATYPQQKINMAWNRVLGSQMHDMLAGTSVPKAYEYCWNDEVIAMNLFAAVLRDSAGTVSRALDTNVEGKAIVVYNPLAIARRDVVEAYMDYPQGAPQQIEVVGPDNKVVASQIISRTDKQIKLLFLADVPPVGYVVFDVRQAEDSREFNTGLSISNNSLENEYYKVVVNDAGDIESIYDKTAERQLLAESARLAFLHESPKEYPAWNMDWDDRQKPPIGYVEGPADIRVVENGPVRVSLAITRKSRNSVFTQYIHLSCDDAGKIVEIKNDVEWRSQSCSLKAVFPLTIGNSVATYNMGLGTIERSNNNEKKYEVPSHEWIDLTDSSGQYGVSILEDCKSGSDKPDDSTLRLTLLYTPQATKKRYLDQQTQDWGRHEFTYAIYGHKGNWVQAKSEWQGRRLNQPLVVFEAPRRGGKLGKVYSFASLNTDQVDIRAIKKAEKDNYVIVRVQELSGRGVKNVRLSMADGIEFAYEASGQESKIAPAVVKDSKLVFDMNAFGIRSFALKLKPSSIKLSKPICQTVALDFNADVISTDKNTADGKMDDCGRSLPAEMIPPMIVSEGIVFKVSPMEDRRSNAIVCNGQKLKLPKGNYNRIYLLASADEDTTGTFKIGSEQRQPMIQQWTGFIGQYDNRIWDRQFAKVDYVAEANVVRVATGYIKRDDIAWFCTHRHSPRGNEAYKFSYIFKYALNIPAGAHDLVLANNSKIKIFAVTVANNQNDFVREVYPVYDDFTSRQPIDLQ
jgi:alpha-mannosidase